MKICTIVGARPQFVKAAMVSRAFAELPDLVERVIHTGQHYDEKMSDIFFSQLAIPQPAYNLQAGSGTHGRQTGLMLERLEEVYLAEKPDAVLVYGDTNSTLAGALAASKLHIRVVHIEAGLRSFNRRMPEEINRVLTDHISDLLFCPTIEAVENLAKEGITGGVHHVGDVMYDCALFFSEHAEKTVSPLTTLGLSQGDYVLLTCHRAENTDDRSRLANIVASINQIARNQPVVFPLHPRTRKQLVTFELALSPDVKLLEPLSYLEMLVLERNASVILTDSGGVQKEAFIFGVPCVTLRDETEWVETISSGANVLAGAETSTIIAAVHAANAVDRRVIDPTKYYGDGHAGRRIASLISSSN